MSSLDAIIAVAAVFLLAFTVHALDGKRRSS